MNFRILYIILIINAFSGCSSMHAPTYKTTLPKNTNQTLDKIDTSSDLLTDADNLQSPQSHRQQSKLKYRFQDTNLIELPALIAVQDTSNMEINQVQIANSHQTAIDMFDNALQEFDNQNFTQCCSKFNAIAETFLATDSLYFEAKFYECECKIVENKVIDAKLLLEALYSDPHIPARVMERVIVRLGQIHCLLKNPQEANKYFIELKTNYPNSIYQKVANCEAIAQPSK